MKIPATLSVNRPLTEASERVRTYAELLPVLILSVIMLYPIVLEAQSVNESIGGQNQIDTTTTYLFYLHGGIVQTRGPEAVSPYWGRYEYAAIVDSLNNLGYMVISEVRPPQSQVEEYAETISRHIGNLLSAGVPPGRIVVVGASMGASIALNVSILVKNRRVKYALLGICRKSSWDAYLDHYSPGEAVLCGNFLSIYERSDSYGSCIGYIDVSQSCISGFKEVALDMGNGHGFLYKPYDAWVKPLAEWIRNRE